MNTGKALWVEDDATVGHPDHETLDIALRDRFDVNVSDLKVIEREDEGDAFRDLVECTKTNKRFVLYRTFPGSSSIHEC